MARQIRALPHGAFLSGENRGGERAFFGGGGAYRIALRPCLMHVWLIDLSHTTHHHTHRAEVGGGGGGQELQVGAFFLFYDHVRFIHLSIHPPISHPPNKATWHLQKNIICTNGQQTTPTHPTHVPSKNSLGDAKIIYTQTAKKSTHQTNPSPPTTPHTYHLKTAWASGSCCAWRGRSSGTARSCSWTRPQARVRVYFGID